MEEKCGIKLSVQAAIIAIVDLSQLFVSGDNSQYMLNLLSVVECQQNETLWRTKKGAH